MAEKVEVSGGGDFDGAILKNAATEATLERLATAMESKQKGLGQQVLGIATKVIQGNVKAQQKSTSAFGSFTNTLNQGSKVSTKLFDVFSTIAGTALGTTFSLLTTAGMTFLDFVRDGYKAFQETSDVGAAFNNDLFQLRRSAADALIPLDEYTELIKKNSETFARLGSTVTLGTIKFGEVANYLKKDFGNELVGLGFSLKDLNEGAASYLETQARLGRIDQRSSKELAESTRDYLLELDKVTKLTGMSRKAQEELARKAAVDPIIQSMLEGIDKSSEAFKKGQANLAILQQIGGDRAVQYAKELAAMRPGPEAAMFAQQLNMNMEDFLALIKGETDPQAFITALKTRRQQTKAMDEETRKQQTAIMMSSQGFADAYQSLQRVEGLGDFKSAQEEQENREKITESLGVFANTLNTIYNDSIAGLLKSPIFKQLQMNLQKLSDIFIKNSGTFVKMFEDLVDGLNFALGNLVTNLSTGSFSDAIMYFFEDLFSQVGRVLGPVVNDFIGNMFGETPEQKAKRKEYEAATPEQKKQMEKENPALKSGLGDILGNLVANIKNLIPSFADLALYLGMGAGGTLIAGAGLAMGLNLLGKGMQGVAAPAMELGAAIGMTGLGVGAAFYGLSKVIDAVSNSFTRIKDFFVGMQSVDSTKMASVGDSIKPLADGVKTLVSAGFQTLIGGGGLEVFAVAMQRFNTVDPTKIEAVGPALKALHDGVAAFSQGDVLENVSGAIKSLFSGGSLVAISETVSKIGDLKIDPTNISTLAKFMDALSKFATINEVNVNVASISGVLEKLSDIKNINFDNINFDPLVKAFDTLTNIKNVNFDNINIDPLVKALDVITQFSNINIENINMKPVIDSINSISTNLDAQNLQNSLGSIKHTLETFQIDQSNIENVVSAVGKLKTTMSDNFTIDTKGVDDFNKSIKTLVDTLGSLENQMKKTSTTNVNVTGNENGRRILPTEISGNTPEDMQRQLNMKIDELISHIVEMKQNTKDTADSLSDRRNAV